MASGITCELNKCNRPTGVIYLKKCICDYHWHMYANEKIDQLRKLLGLPPVSTIKYVIPIGETTQTPNSAPTPKEEYLIRRAKAVKEKPTEVSVESIETEVPTVEVEVKEQVPETQTETTVEAKEKEMSDTQNVQSKNTKREAKYGRDPETGLSLTKDGKVRKARSDKGQPRASRKNKTE